MVYNLFLPHTHILHYTIMLQLNSLDFRRATNSLFWFLFNTRIVIIISSTFRLKKWECSIVRAFLLCFWQWQFCVWRKSNIDVIKVQYLLNEEYDMELRTSRPVQPITCAFWLDALTWYLELFFFFFFFNKN